MLLSRLIGNSKNLGARLSKYSLHYMSHFSFSMGKVITVRLHDLGEGTKEAMIKKWYKNVGETVEEEENLVEVTTDKIVADIPSPGKGRVSKINYDLNQSCLVGNVLCEIIEDEVNMKELKDRPAETNSNIDEESEVHDIVADAVNKSKSTPSVRFMMKQNGVNAKDINPSGKNGRILKEDVINYLEKGKSQKSTIVDKVTNLEEASMPQSGESKQVKEVSSKSSIVLDTQTTPDYISSITLQDRVVKLEGFRKTMVKTMTQSTQIPSFLYTDELNVDKLVRLRKEMNKIDTKLKLSYMPFFIKAISYALLQYPDLNSNVNTTKIENGLITEYIVKKDHNISIAIDTEHGLIVPNIKRVQDKSIVQIQIELNLLREKAKNQKITLDDYKDGSFTVSNIGNIGGKVLSPVIMSPQVCIIGISRFFDSVTVVPKQDEYHESQAYHHVDDKNLSILFHKAVNICISADHRVLDGATVARFSECLKSYLENPLKIWIGN